MKEGNEDFEESHDRLCIVGEHIDHPKEKIGLAEIDMKRRSSPKADLPTYRRVLLSVFKFEAPKRVCKRSLCLDE